MLNKVIAIVNQKGGVSKSTVSINLAFGLAERNFDVLLVDGDPQSSVLDWADVRSQTELDTKFTVMGMPKNNMSKEIEKIKSKYDFIIIDGAGRASDLTRQAIIACDIAIVPNSTSPFDAWATKATIKDIEEIQGYRKFSAYFLLSKIKVNTKVYKDVKSYIGEAYELPILSSIIPDRTAYSGTIGDGLTIFESKDKKSILAMDSLINEILERENLR